MLQTTTDSNLQCLLSHCGCYRYCGIGQCLFRKAQSHMATKIAVIDDDAGMRLTLRDLLRSLDYAVEHFASAEEFLSNEVDDTSCIITDVRMPGMGGVALQTRLIAQSRPIPMIFMTAFPEDAIKERVLGAGAFGYLTKPFQQQSLIDCLSRALQA